VRLQLLAEAAVPMCFAGWVSLVVDSHAPQVRNETVRKGSLAIPFFARLTACFRCKKKWGLRKFNGKWSNGSLKIKA